jgi:hypothetical protein
MSQAKSVVDEMHSLKPVPGVTLTSGYANSAIPARYALERRNWQEAGSLVASADGVPWARAITWMAIGIGSARIGNLDRASQAEHMLVTLRDAASQDIYWSNQIEVQRREVAAWIAEKTAGKNGNVADAIATMRSAAELEESMDKHAVTPGAVLPAREMLAELLLIHGQFRESLTEYQAVLAIAPSRFNALYGAANAAEASGNAMLAWVFRRKLGEAAVGDERPELVSARKKTVIPQPRVEY